MTLSINHISKQFGSRRVIDDLSLTVGPGQVCAITGHNGAGKTTLLRIVAGLVEADSGTVSLDGLGPAEAMPRMGYLPEERGLYRNMRAGEQVEYFARLKGLTRRQATEAARHCFTRWGMADRYASRVSTLSKGLQQRVQFMAAVAHGPRLLLLDEPLSGFDAEGSEMLFAEVGRLRAEGTAILLSTHNREAVDRLADKEVRL